MLKMYSLQCRRFYFHLCYNTNPEVVVNPDRNPLVFIITMINHINTLIIYSHNVLTLNKVEIDQHETGKSYEQENSKTPSRNNKLDLRENI